MNSDNEFDQFNYPDEPKKGYKLLLKFEPLFDGQDLQLPSMEIGEPKRPFTKVVVRNAIRNPKPGLF